MDSISSPPIGSENSNVSLSKILGTILCSLALYLAIGATRRVYFHPLSKYKGPSLLATTNSFHIWYNLRGEWVHKVLSLHEEYGPVVRVAPNELSYVSEAAWSDIYKHRMGKEQLKKYMPTIPADFEHGLFDNPDDAEHAKIRKMLSPALSARGVFDREPVLRKHVSLLVAQLKKMSAATDGAIVNIVEWYQSTTVDITGDLLSGESFHSLEQSQVNPLLKIVYRNLKMLAIGTAFNRSPILRHGIVRQRAPASGPLWQIGKERFHNYQPQPTSQVAGFVSYLQQNINTPSGITTLQAERVTTDFILAGSDTVAIALSGATYLLLRHPSKLKRLKAELHSTFQSADDITLANVNKLQYQNAVITETLRLWPPGPETLRRVTNRPDGNVIDGEWVPPNTLVGVYHWVAGRYTRAWKDAGEFDPERWLNDGNQNKDDGEGGHHHDNHYKNDQRNVMNSFNLGPRNCVGQNLAMAELRLILSFIFWNFDMELKDPEDDGDWMKTKIWGLVAEKKPLMVKIKPV